MTPRDNTKRRLIRNALAGLAGVVLAGCDRLTNSEWFPRVLGAGEKLSYRAQHLLGARTAMAQEFTEADLSPEFRSNGTAMPESAQYQALVNNGFADWSLEIGGLVEKPARFTLAELRAMPSRTQITRHDCVEGWSAIGKWTGVPLGTVLAQVRPTSAARYVVFRCADPMGDGDTPPYYYESIDMIDANHPQTILAYALNDRDLPIANGAPIRVRVERQLGYKHAKYIMRIELVETFDSIAGGNGGYWEDQGYQWYAGI